MPILKETDKLSPLIHSLRYIQKQTKVALPFRVALVGLESYLYVTLRKWIDMKSNGITPAGAIHDELLEFRELSNSKIFLYSGANQSSATF